MLRHNLEILATVAADWLVPQGDARWFERYSVRVEQSKSLHAAHARHKESSFRERYAPD